MTASDRLAPLAEVARLRRGVVPDAVRADPGEQARLAALIESSPALRALPTAQALTADLRGFADDPRMTRTKAHINAAVDRQLFSVFRVPYFPSLALDYLVYTPVHTDESVLTAYPSNTMAVTVDAATDGFTPPGVVALFPEHHLDGVQDDDDLIFYFIDKFVTRHFRVTRPMIEQVMAEGSFPSLAHAGTAAVRQVSAWWVRMHEHHHRLGPMPIPGYLKAKSAKPLAGLEELRTDVSSMLACLHDRTLPAADALLTYEYVLAERLLRYAVEGIPRPNYDAVASQLLFTYLRSRGGLELRADRLHLTGELPAVLAALHAEIDRIEQHIQHEPVADVRRRLLEFTNRYTAFDERAGDYRHLPFFSRVKERLGV
ncbi:DUF6421 family protein [Amycolatopsis sp. NPDC051061]|uniref:DUF6421 family protein n=1 Tax=Amycolatopsis sp. NPDC051061 TaxID=3155042 RepID=UPI00342E04F6